MTPRFRMVAGPNGSGKTTLMRRLAADYAVNFYDVLNADDIFAEVSRTGAYAPKVSVPDGLIRSYAKTTSYPDDVKALFRDGAITVESDLIRFRSPDAAASREAIAEAFAAGLPVTVLRGGRVVRVTPEGVEINPGGQKWER